MQNGKKKAKVFFAVLSKDAKGEQKMPTPVSKKARIGSVLAQSN